MVTVRSFDVPDPSSTSPTCSLVRLHLTALANKRILVSDNSLEHAVFKDMVMQITGASATGSGRLERCT